MDCIVHRLAKSQTRLSDFHFISPRDALYSIYTDYLIVILTSMFLAPIFPVLFLYLEILLSGSFAY